MFVHNCSNKISFYGESRRMTVAAREVLADCRIALELLEQETDLNRWRVHWAGAVALVRAVGHVLDKIDGNDPYVRAAAHGAFLRWKGDDPKYEIFREFIEPERNNILKEYRFRHHPLEEVPVAIELMLRGTAGELRRHTEIFELGDNIYRPMLNGYREGDDARDVLEEALDWWAAELDEIDAQTARTRVGRA
jgi:hypothetical protein